MEFWLTFNSLGERLQLPVPPSEFTIKTGTTVNTVNINNVGEVALIGKGKLATIEISSFFPSKAYSFCRYSDFPPPYECVKTIERWRDSGKPMRLIVTDTNINLPCCIEGFDYGEKDATGDVYFTLSLKEYRFLVNVDQMKIIGEQFVAILSQRVVETQQASTYTVKEGDTLPIIAKKVYGDISKYTTLMSKNGISDISNIYTGQVLKI